MALWNFTIPDTSPIFTYQPYADGFGLQSGWQTWYTVSGFNKNPGDSSHGDSFHLTSLDGAEVSLEFYGSAIYLYGTANASYEVVLDDAAQSLSATTDLLYSSDGLIEEHHVVTLRARPSSTTQQLGFSHAVVSASPGGKTSTQVFHDNFDTSLSYSGQWTTNTVQGIPNNTVTAPFHQTVDAGASAQMNFSSAVAVAVHASTNFGHGLYSVSLDGVPQIYNGSTFWLVTDTVIFFQSGLDPTRVYALDMINMSGGGKLTLSSVVTYQVDQPQPPNTTGTPAATRGTSSHTAKVAEIAGPVAGVVVVLGLVSVFFWLRSRKRRVDPAASISPLILPQSAPSEMAQTRTPSARKGNGPALQSAPSPPLTMATAISPTSPAGSADVNHIIELIAQRIDRRDGSQGQSHGWENALPPGYNHSVDSV
ncbi:hypothetical protein B0H13DRAFT_2008975 [Mycena leptocephala]|nr:hypothetical protein B0H13DRAFT_2008975 [Mycena leptocephala]